MADLNRYSSSMFENTIVPEQSTFGETLGASLGLRYAPMFERAVIGARFANQERDPNFDWKENLGNYSMYASSLYGAKNSEHMSELKSVIDRSTGRRQVLYNSTFMQELKAGLFDPVNYFALPLGGPSVGIVGSALRVGAGTAIIEGAAETINLQLDPAKTLEEAAMTTAGGFIFGAGFGGLLGAGKGVGRSVRATAFKRTNEANEEIFQAVTRVEYLEGMTPDDIKNAPVRKERPLGKLTDLEINERIQSYKGGEEALPFKNELGLRKIEELGVDIDDVYNLKSSWFTKSPLYKMVSTPMKRTLQSDASPFVKETTLKSFGDNGITLVLNSLGLATPQSVAVRTAVHAGRWVKANDEMLKLWAVDTGASSASRLDINLSDVTRKLSRSDQTYRQWLTNVSEKRLRGVTDMSENEFQASQIINRYFKTSEARLESVGLINSAKGIKRQIEMLEVEVASLKADLSKVVSRESREYLQIQSRLKKVEGRKNLAEDKLAGFIDNSGVDPEPFFPRFFDAKIIKRRRQEFEGILIKWFEENPHIYRSDDKLSGKVVKVELSTDKNDIRDRARKTIRKILNEKDPYDLENISFGMGKSKHFRTRGLDIPNNLVTDFMMKDPLAVMKTYAARIEPRYEYAKMFGKDVDGVRFDLIMDMIREGRSETYINKIMRDYNHMYDRTVGAVLENPDSLSQKAATIMREAASFSYMGSSGLAAIPDFGRIVMEYDMENVWKGVQALVDKERLNMTVDEARKAGEAIDILKGSAHMRMYEDMSNSIDANDVLSQTRNAFYILNGLAPLTTLAKQLAGVIDAHQIIEYSIKLGKGQLDDQSTEWLARYGIGKDMAAKIAEMPWQKTEFGLYMANTDEWVGDAIIDSLAKKGFKYKFPSQNLSKLSDKKLTSHFAKEFEGANIYTDPKIVKPYFERVKREGGFGNILGYFVDFRDIGGRGPSQGFAVHIDKEAVKARFDAIKSDPRSGDQILKDAKDILDNKVKPKPMFDLDTVNSKIAKLRKELSSKDEEVNFLKKERELSEVDQAKEIENAREELTKTRSLRINTFAERQALVRRLEKSENDSQDYFENMQKGFEPDREELRRLLDISAELATSIKILDDELKITDKAIENSESGLESLIKLQGIKNKKSPKQKEISDAYDEYLEIEKEIDAREFIKPLKIDYDNLSQSLKNDLKELTDMYEELDIAESFDIDEGNFNDSIRASRVRDLRLRSKEAFSNFKKKAEDEVKDLDIKTQPKMNKEIFAHLKNEIEAADLFEEADDYFEYILMHELQHSVIRKGVNETIESYEDRIDKAAINYIRNKQEQGKQNALELRKQKVLEEQEEVVMQFRAALNSGILNTIMSGTPADKPIITDGVVYIPMSVASKFGMKEHAKFKGYARIENGLMGLPFQFYSFVFANVNKTVGALAQGQIKNRAIGSATMMGLAYMSLSYRTPDYIWEDMSAQDRFVRSFDMSGIMALYSDIFYTAMHTSLALGGPNITGGLISPKYKQEPSVVDALTGLAGAGPSWTYDTAKGIVNFASGNYGEGGKDIARNLPFGRMWFWKDEVNQITNAWAN